jgi:hypothetical protein
VACSAVSSGRVIARPHGPSPLPLPPQKRPLYLFQGIEVKLAAGTALPAGKNSLHPTTAFLGMRLMPFNAING